MNEPSHTPLVYFLNQRHVCSYSLKCRHISVATTHTPLVLVLILVLVDKPDSSKLLRQKKKMSPVRSFEISNTGEGLRSRCHQASFPEVKLAATHASLPSPSCDARDVRSGSELYTELLGVTMSSWLTTSWFRLSGSESHFTSMPKPAENRKCQP